MSSFQVSNKTINRIANRLIGEGFYKDKLANDLGIMSREGLAKALYEMNCEALRQRYGECDVADFPTNITQIFPSNIQEYKSLRCFLYQCSEGNVPETELFKIVEDYTNSLGYSIIYDLNEYQQAKWE